MCNRLLNIFSFFTYIQVIFVINRQLAIQENLPPIWLHVTIVFQCMREIRLK